MIIRKVGLTGTASRNMLAGVSSGRNFSFALLFNYARVRLLPYNLYNYPGFCGVRVTGLHHSLPPLLNRLDSASLARFRLLPSLNMLAELAADINSMAGAIPGGISCRVVYKRSRATALVISRGPMARKKQSRLQFSIVRRPIVFSASGVVVSRSAFLALATWELGATTIGRLLASAQRLSYLGGSLCTPSVVTRVCSTSLLGSFMLFE